MLMCQCLIDSTPRIKISSVKAIELSRDVDLNIEFFRVFSYSVVFLQLNFQMTQMLLSERLSLG